MPDTTPPGLAPETAAPAAEISPVTAAPSAPAGSLQKPQDTTLVDRVKSAKTPLELRQALEDLQKPVPETPPVETPAPAEEPAAPAPEGETPVETPAEEPAAEPAAEPTPEPEDTAPEPSTAKNLRLSLPDNDKVGRLATQYLRRNKDWTLEQAMAAAKNQLGIKPTETTPAKSPETPAPTPAANALPSTVADTDRAIETMEGEMQKAATELRMEDYHKLVSNVRQLERHRSGLERNAERAQQAKAAEYDTQFDASHAQAIELYPDAAKADSAFGKRMKEIDETLKETEDPLYGSPDKPRKIAQMVAAEMSIAPRRKGAAPVTPAKPAALPAATPKPKSVLPGGSNGTIPAAPQKDAIISKAEAAKTPLEMRTLLKELGVPNPGF